MRRCSFDLGHGDHRLFFFLPSLFTVTHPHTFIPLLAQAACSMDDSLSSSASPATITTTTTTTVSSLWSSFCGNMQHPLSKTPPTSRLYFLMQTTPPLEDNNSNSAMDVDDLAKETPATASSYHGVRFQPGTRFHVQTRPRPPLTPRRPRARISEPSILGLPRKLDLTRLLYDGRDDGEIDARSWSGTKLDRSESETKHTKSKGGQLSNDSSCAVRSHTLQSSESGEDGPMDLDTDSSRLQDDPKKSTPGISHGLQNKGLFSLRHENIHPLNKVPESKKRIWPSVEDAGSRHSDFNTTGVDNDDGRTDEDEFWDPKVDKVNQGLTHRYLKQRSLDSTIRSTDAAIQPPLRLQHLLQTIPGEIGHALLTPGKSSSSKSEGQGYDNMLGLPFSPTSSTHWHGRQPSEANTPPFLSHHGNMGYGSASHARGSPYPPSRSSTRHDRAKAIAAVRGCESLAAVAMQIPSSNLSSSPNYLPLLSVKTPAGGSSKYEIVSLQTPGRSIPRHYAVENEERTDRDWPSSPLSSHYLKPDRTEDDIEDKLYTAPPYTQVSHIPSSASHDSYRSSYSPVDGEEGQKENDSTGNANFSSLAGYMTPKRSSSSSTPPGPPIRNRNVRTRIASLQDAPTRCRLSSSPIVQLANFFEIQSLADDDHHINILTYNPIPLQSLRLRAVALFPEAE